MCGILTFSLFRTDKLEHYRCVDIRLKVKLLKFNLVSLEYEKTSKNLLVGNPHIMWKWIMTNEDNEKKIQKLILTPDKDDYKMKCVT